eukprot:scaffold244166_cov33-Prasinocladus_malaysianus.AAC.1
MFAPVVSPQSAHECFYTLRYMQEFSASINPKCLFFDSIATLKLYERNSACHERACPAAFKPTTVRLRYDGNQHIKIRTHIRGLRLWKMTRA